MFSYDVQDVQEYLDPKRNRVRLAIQKTEDLTSHANKTMTSSVFRANVTVDGQPETPKFEAAVKKLLFNKQERTVLELDVLFLLTTDHPHKNILQLLYYQNTEIRGTDKTLTRLTMIFRMMPKTLFHLREQLSNSHDILDIKLFMWQLCVGLDHLRRLRIIHRDIKPSNLLVDPVSGRLTIADFGSAVIYVKCQHLQFSAYAVSRPYRPPELLLGSRHYSCMVDIWSAGCVLAELYIGEPLIYSLHNTADQLRLVYELFGTPTADDLKAMNVEMEALKPNKQQQSALDQLTKRFKEKRVLDEDNPAEFLLKLLQFNPDNRLHGADLLGDPFFDEVFRVGRRKNGGAVANCVRKEDRIEAIGTEV